MTRESILKRFFIISMFIALTAAAAFAQSTAFSFQGRLNDGTNPANGRYDLEFRLFNTITGGAQIGSTLTRPNTILINGVFSTTLDFGASAFNNPNNVFIEISVKPGGSTNAFTILGPRQQLTAVPFAIRATNATNADNAANATNAVNSQNATNATTATTATTATNALSLGGVPAANYAQLNIINPGQLIIDGNLRQSLNSNGLVKAMIFVTANAQIARCYNGFTNTSSGNCGFTVTHVPFQGNYIIDFGFKVDDRFYSAVTEVSGPIINGSVIPYVATVISGAPNTTPNQIYTRTIRTDQNSPADVGFVLIVY